jgi:hypothetical protein
MTDYRGFRMSDYNEALIKSERLRFKKDEYLKVKQMHVLHDYAFVAAQNAEYTSKMAKIAAEKAFIETKVRLEILEEELGITEGRPE